MTREPVSPSCTGRGSARSRSAGRGRIWLEDGDETNFRARGRPRGICRDRFRRVPRKSCAGVAALTRVPVRTSSFRRLARRSGRGSPSAWSGRSAGRLSAYALSTVCSGKRAPLSWHLDIDAADADLNDACRPTAARGEIMATFEERQKSFEQKYRRDQDKLFRITARRNRLLGLWRQGSSACPEIPRPNTRRKSCTRTSRNRGMPTWCGRFLRTSRLTDRNGRVAAARGNGAIAGRGGAADRLRTGLKLRFGVVRPKTRSKMVSTCFR